MVYVKKSDREKRDLNRKSPILKTTEAAHMVDKNSRTLQKAKVLCETLRSKNITEDEKDIIRRILDKYKKRVNRRLSKLTAWSDTSPEVRLQDLRPPMLLKSDNRETQKVLQAYMASGTQKYFLLKQQEKLNSTSQKQQINSSSNNNTSNGNSSSNITVNIPKPDQATQLQHQQSILQEQVLVIQNQGKTREPDTSATQSTSASSYNIQSLIDAQQTSSANAIKSLKEDL